ncbi:hypothetical protein WP8W19C02_28160 [Enterobacter cloacae]|nr:hypothetical protein WP8W19C02_28160 [Enterobacter cloacae]
MSQHSLSCVLARSTLLVVQSLINTNLSLHLFHVSFVVSDLLNFFNVLRYLICVFVVSSDNLCIVVWMLVSCALLVEQSLINTNLRLHLLHMSLVVSDLLDFFDMLRYLICVFVVSSDNLSIVVWMLVSCTLLVEQSLINTNLHLHLLHMSLVVSDLLDFFDMLRYLICVFVVSSDNLSIVVWMLVSCTLNVRIS